MQNNNSEAYLSTIQQGKRKKRIMAVDDEEDVTFCLGTVLQETGLPMTKTAYADVGDAPIDADEISNTDIESNIEPNIVIGGINAKAQNCAENNINSQNTAGDEGLDCHNSQDEATEQAASD